MNPDDLAILNGATALAQRGQKSTAYALLKPMLKVYPNDVNLLLWIAFTAPDLAESEFAIIKAGMVDPDHAGLTSARNWFASAVAAHKAQNTPEQVESPSLSDFEDAPTPKPRPNFDPLTSPLLSSASQTATALIEPPPSSTASVAILPAMPAKQEPNKAPEVAPTHESTPQLSSINWADYYPHLYTQVPVPAWALPVTLVQPPPAPEPVQEPEPVVNPEPLQPRKSSGWTKAVKGFFSK